MKIPAKPPSVPTLLAKLAPEKFGQILTLNWGMAPGGRYRHWEKVRRIAPPEGFSTEQYWLGIKIARSFSRRELPGLLDHDGLPFSYTLPEPLLAMLHEIDRKKAGQVALPGAATAENAERHLRSSLVEEAITSSQLEGASTTRPVAKAMLHSGRPAQNRSEQMILNNHRAMHRIADLAKSPLSVKVIEDLHSTLTEDTADQPIGYRTHGDGTAVYDQMSNLILFNPPPADESRHRLEALCAFANAETPTIHPAIKAVVIHFWLAYVHPFSDGNGRTARALFYWAMKHHGYWLAEFVSISRLLRLAPARYGRAYLYTETDDNDLTYFILHALDTFLRGVSELEKYIVRKEAEYRSVAASLSPGGGLNHRQIALLSHAVRHPDHPYTIESHKNHHGVVYQTARTDLLELAELGLLVKEKRGRNFVFAAATDLAVRLRRPG